MVMRFPRGSVTPEIAGSSPVAPARSTSSRGSTRAKLFGAGEEIEPPVVARHQAALGVLEVALPVAHPADSFPRSLVDDLELLGIGLLVTRLTFRDLLLALRPAKMFHHHRIAEQLLQKREIRSAPRLKANPCSLATFEMRTRTDHASESRRDVATAGNRELPSRARWSPVAPPVPISAKSKERAR